MSKIAFIGEHVSVAALFAQILEREKMEAVVAVVRVDGCWYSTWSSGIDNGGLSMAAIKLMSDVQGRMHDEPLTWSPTQGDAA